MNTMIFSGIVLAVGVCLVSAEFTCPDGKVTCSHGKACCFESGSGYRCCDHPDDTSELIPGTLSAGHPFSNLTLSSMPQGGPDIFPYDYCPYTTGKRICCHLNPPYTCTPRAECCNQESACCFNGLRCCGNGQWCCKKKDRCGPYFNTCRNGAGLQGAQGMAMIIAVALAVIKFAKI